MEKRCGYKNDKSLYSALLHARNIGDKWTTILIHVENLNTAICEGEINFRTFLFEGMSTRGKTVHGVLISDECNIGVFY